MVGPFSLLLPYISHTPIGPGESKKKAGEGWAFSGLQRGPKEGRINGTHTAMFRPRRLCIIAIIPVRCKESPLRPGRGGIGPLGPEGRQRYRAPEGTRRGRRNFTGTVGCGRCEGSPAPEQMVGPSYTSSTKIL